MRLTDRVATHVIDAITAHTLPGEDWDHDVTLAMVSVPGGQVPEYTIVIVGYDDSTPHVADPITIQDPAPSASTVEDQVEDAMASVRAMM